jgi:hypothetical protein
VEIIGGVLDARARLRREQRHRDLEYLNAHSSLPRLRLCGRRIAREGPVEVVVRDGTCHFRNVVRCASVHACPVCAAKIRQQRAVEIEALLDRHSDVGGGAELVTFTVPHHFGQPLAELLAALQVAWDALTKNRAGRQIKARYGFVGFVRALEVTHGPNGWHPHLHVLWLTERPITVDERQALTVELYRAWKVAAVAVGLAAPSRRHGVDVRSARRGEGLGRYVVGMELARADLKRGRDAD